MQHIIRISLLILAFSIMQNAINPNELSAQDSPGQTSGVPPFHKHVSPLTRAERHQAKLRKLKAYRRRKHVQDSLAALENHLTDSLARIAQRHYPLPGTSGEERNFDWLRTRAFPNEYIDPEAYSSA